MDLIDIILSTYEEELRDEDNPRVKVKNSVWNIDEKFPNEVTKSNVSGRNALFLPTGKSVIRNPGGRKLRKKSQESLDYIDTKSIMQSTWFAINDLESAVDRLSIFIEHINMVKPKHLAMLQMDDIRTIFALQEALDAIKKCRTLVANREDIIYWTLEDEERYEYEDPTNSEDD